MRKTDNKPTWKPAKTSNKIPTHPKWISSETQTRRRKAVKKAEKYGMVQTEKQKEELTAIVEEFTFYDPDEKYRLPDLRAIIDNLVLSAKAFEEALEAVTDPDLRRIIELPKQYGLYDTHRHLLDMVQAYQHDHPPLKSRASSGCRETSYLPALN
jgi:hypothetical protein